MTLSRRSMLALGAGLGAAALTARPRAAAAQAAGGPDADWEAVRALFDLSPDRVHMSAMLITGHPRPVREAIERHRRALDRDPVEYLEANGDRLTEEARVAAARRLGVPPANVALVESTTAGVGLVYGGLLLREGQEVLSTDYDYYVTHEALRQAAGRTGATMRLTSLFGRVAEASEDRIVERVTGAIRPETRLLALTWVQSNTGLKVPAAAIGARLAEINAGRDEADQVLFGLDAVHGFGIETEGPDAIGCDFFMAGCHKWLFGPRGTGVVAFSDRGLRAVAPVIPTFDDAEVFSAWYAARPDRPANTGLAMTPGGFKAFEHR